MKIMFPSPYRGLFLIPTHKIIRKPLWPWFPSPYRGLFLIPNSSSQMGGQVGSFRPLIGDCFLY